MTRVPDEEAQRAMRGEPDLPADWGKINGEDHPDTVIANANWNAALDKMLHLIRVRQHQWPKHSSMYVSLEDVVRDAQALRR